MRPDDDDDAEGGGGPPPDPSLRAWRHPSEIAAAAAAAERPVRPERSLSPVVGRVAVLTSLALVATATALVLGTAIALRADPATTRPGVTGQAALVPRDAPTTASSSRSDGPGAGDGAGEGAAANGNDPDSTVDGSSPDDPDDSSSTSTTSAGARPTPTDDASPAEAWYQDGKALAAADIGDGVYSRLDGSVGRLGSFLVSADLVFTSTSALDGATDVVLRVDGTTIPATVIGADSVTDVAVLTLDTSGPGLGPLGATIVDGDTGSAPADEAGAGGADGDGAGGAEDDGSGAGLASGSELTLDLPAGVGIEGVADGMAIGQVRRTTAVSGASVYDLLLTTVHRPEGASGAGVVDSEGRPIGMVADTPGYLTRVVPIDVVLAVGRSYQQWGAPSDEWLGVEGVSGPAGAEITAIEPGSPAESADLRVGDLITRIDGESVTDWEHLVYLIRRTGAGRPISIDIQRGDAVASVNTVVGARQSPSD